LELSPTSSRPEIGVAVLGAGPTAGRTGHQRDGAGGRRTRTPPIRAPATYQHQKE